MHLKEDTFRFKRFDIIQNQFVHRVGTDGVLLGAWIDIKDTNRILDVGTGTGLIGLMLAQRTERGASITALESDPKAFALAIRNAKASRFANSIKVVNLRVQDFKGDKFDLIVCNPPFFKNSLKPSTESRTRQRHSVDLSVEDLLTATATLLSPEGKLNLILPTEAGNSFIALATSFGLHNSRLCELYAKVGKACERYLLELSATEYNRTEKSSLIIMDTEGEWTPEYKSLTREFYLKL